jgi:hypothetical protein
MDDYDGSRIVIVYNVILLNFLTTFESLFFLGSKYWVKNDYNKY